MSSTNKDPSVLFAEGRIRSCFSVAQQALRREIISCLSDDDDDLRFGEYDAFRQAMIGLKMLTGPEVREVERVARAKVPQSDAEYQLGLGGGQPRDDSPLWRLALDGLLKAYDSP